MYDIVNEKMNPPSVLTGEYSTGNASNLIENAAAADYPVIKTSCCFVPS